MERSKKRPHAFSRFPHLRTCPLVNGHVTLQTRLAGDPLAADLAEDEKARVGVPGLALQRPLAGVLLLVQPEKGLKMGAEVALVALEPRLHTVDDLHVVHEGLFLFEGEVALLAAEVSLLPRLFFR